VEALSDAGVSCVFGIPGTQIIELFEALRLSEIRTVLAASEMGAAFMAAAWGRFTGIPGVLITMPGPGFTCALTGLAEARLDSVPLLHITVSAPVSPLGRQFLQQEVSQSLIASHLTKAVINIDGDSDPHAAVSRALRIAASGEPGPVLVQALPKALGEHEWVDEIETHTVADSGSVQLAAVREKVTAARRPVFFVGTGALRSADMLRAAAEALGAPVLTTPSARGIISDNHPLQLGFDPVKENLGEVNSLLGSADLIIVLGAKLGHNGTSGFNLNLPPDRLIQVDTDSQVIGANYPVSLGVVSDAGAVLAALLNPSLPKSSWQESELLDRRTRIKVSSDQAEPRVGGSETRDGKGFFAGLRSALPPHAVLVLDSGLHQILARRYYKVLRPGGLVFPADLQSMGFGVPSAIGASIGAPERPVIAIVGDGGFAMTGLEVLTAVRERVRLILIVFVDGTLGQIRLHQLANYGASHAVKLLNPDFAALSAAVGAHYALVGDDAIQVIRDALENEGVTVIEVPVGDSMNTRRVAAVARARETVRRAVGTRLIDLVRRLFGRS